MTEIMKASWKDPSRGHEKVVMPDTLMGFLWVVMMVLPWVMMMEMEKSAWLSETRPFLQL